MVVERNDDSFFLAVPAEKQVSIVRTYVIYQKKMAALTDLLISINSKLPPCPTGKHQLTINELAKLIHVAKGYRVPVLQTCRNHWNQVCVAEHELDNERRRIRLQIKDTLDSSAEAYYDVEVYYLDYMI
jgi:hypothetical protein